MNHYRSQQPPKISIGEAGVTLTSQSGRVVHAMIVHATRDPDGRLISAMLDRKIHDDNQWYGPTLKMSGCFTTEMDVIREDPEESADDDGTKAEVWSQIDAVLTHELAPHGALDSGVRSSLDVLVTTLSACVMADTQLINFWTRPSLVEELDGRLFGHMDDSDLFDFERPESLATQIIGRVRYLTE